MSERRRTYRGPNPYALKPQPTNPSPVEVPEATERAPGEPRSIRRAIVLKPGKYHLLPLRDYPGSILLTACGRPTWPGNPTTEHWCQQRGYTLCRHCQVAFDAAEKRWEEPPARLETTDRLMANMAAEGSFE